MLHIILHSENLEVNKIYSVLPSELPSSSGDCQEKDQQPKTSACNVGDPCLIPGLGGSPVEGNGNPLQYSCLENSMDGGSWWATVHGVTESGITDFTFSLSKRRVKKLA